jgi:hypothetical protein
VSAGGTCPRGQGLCSAGGCQGGACGKVGERCCGDVGCTAAYSRCEQGVCRSCGGVGQRCCAGANGNYCAAPYVCANVGGGGETCTLCGGAGQPCCPGATCTGGRTCSTQTNTCN